MNGHLLYVNGVNLAISEFQMLPEAFHQVSAQEIYGLDEMSVEEFQDGCLVQDHL